MASLFTIFWDFHWRVWLWIKLVFYFYHEGFLHFSKFLKHNWLSYWFKTCIFNRLHLKYLFSWNNSFSGHIACDLRLRFLTKFNIALLDIFQKLKFLLFQVFKLLKFRISIRRIISSNGFFIFIYFYWWFLTY